MQSVFPAFSFALHMSARKPFVSSLLCYGAIAGHEFFQQSQALGYQNKQICSKNDSSEPRSSLKNQLDLHKNFFVSNDS